LQTQISFIEEQITNNEIIRGLEIFIISIDFRSFDWQSSKLTTRPLCNIMIRQMHMSVQTNIKICIHITTGND